MKDMSVSRQRGKDLVSAYDRSLELQIVGRGSSLACRDEELWKQVEGLLRSGDARETHCLGLDPLGVMEESLTAAASTCRVKYRGPLKGLERAFEVLEQAALNLYLCPWREEYKVVKMYSGVFTHHIKPMFSMPQIEKLFGLLGYQPGSSRHEQLCLKSYRVSAASLENLLCLSCAFFLARCECRLLLAALGDRAGDVQWELGVVRERLAGHNLQVSLDNTKKMLEVDKQVMERSDGEVEVDLYTDVQENGCQKMEVGDDDQSPRSLAWVTPNTASPPAVITQSNGMTSLPYSPTSLSTREVCVSTLNCQLTKTPSPESHISRSSSTNARQRRRVALEPQSHSLQVHTSRSEAAAHQQCSCLQSPHARLKLCEECNALHDTSCALLKCCYNQNHHVVFTDNPTEEMKKSSAMSSHAGDLRASVTSSSVAMSSLALRDEPRSMMAPITYHDCCDLTQPDPKVLCLSCGVFHTGTCIGVNFCREEKHEMKPLGECSCGRVASRDPLVLCRYCGNEYCRDCWYRSPIQCPCGNKYDQSTSV